MTSTMRDHPLSLHLRQVGTALWPSCHRHRVRSRTHLAGNPPERGHRELLKDEQNAPPPEVRPPSDQIQRHRLDQHLLPLRRPTLLL